jgi:hypothetical protein
LRPARFKKAAASDAGLNERPSDRLPAIGNRSLFGQRKTTTRQQCQQSSGDRPGPQHAQHLPDIFAKDSNKTFRAQWQLPKNTLI